MHMRISNFFNRTGLRHESNLQNVPFIWKETYQSIVFLFAYFKDDSKSFGFSQSSNSFY